MVEQHSLAYRAPRTKRSRDAIGRASRRRRFRRVMLAVLLGLIVWGITLGALGQRVIAEDQNDLVPAPLAALLIGVAFVVGSLPTGWSLIGRILLPVPTFFLYLTVFLGKEPPLPFYAAFALAGAYATGFTAIAAYLTERPGRSMLGSRGDAAEVAPQEVARD
jgi:hypothetical protein